MRPIHIGYDARLLSSTFETLGFDFFETGTQAIGHSGYAQKEGDIIGWPRDRYVAGSIPKAISLLAPAQIASGQANDALQADPAIMSPNVFVMPDPSMQPGAPPR